MINYVLNQQYQGNARGAENAYLHHLRNQERKQNLGDNLQQSKIDDEPNISEAAILELSSNTSEVPNTYSLKDFYNPVSTNLNNVQDKLSSNDTLIVGRGTEISINSEVGTDNGSDTIIAGNGAKLDINSEISVDNGNDLLIVGNGAKVEINTRTEIDNSSDTIIIGNGSNVYINSEVGIDNGNDTIIIGNGAKVDISSQVGVDNSNDTLIIENGAKVKLNSSATVDNSNDTIIIGNGVNIEINGSVKIDNLNDLKFENNKITVNLKDEQNRSYKWEIDVKDKTESDSIIEFFKNKPNKSWKFHELKNAVEDEKEVFSIKDNKKKEELTISDFEINNKQFNKYQYKLQLQASVVSLLLNNNMTFTTNLYKTHENNKFGALKTSVINKFV